MTAACRSIGLTTRDIAEYIAHTCLLMVASFCLPAFVAAQEAVSLSVRVAFPVLPALVIEAERCAMLAPHVVPSLENQPFCVGKLPHLAFCRIVVGGHFGLRFVTRA